VTKRVRNHLRTNLVGYIALFFALGLGTAWALDINSVKSRHIKDDQVKTADVRDGSLVGGGLGSADLKLVQRSEVQTEGSTTSSGPADLLTLGPTVTVSVPANGLVAVHAQADLKKDAGPACFVYLSEAGLPGGAVELLSTTSSTYETRQTAPGTGADGTTEPGDGGWVVLPASAGDHVYRLKYGAGTGALSPDCSYRNRVLYVAAIG
jgi:hypothetical protein